MKALTVQQPWSWAIIHGGKLVENRTQLWKYRGPLAIHAGARWSFRGQTSGLVWNALANVGWPVGPAAARDRGLFHFGAAIGVVDLVDVHPEQGGCCPPWGEASYVEHGGTKRIDVVHLVLENPRPCDPIPLPGRLGLWNLPDDVAAVLS